MQSPLPTCLELAQDGERLCREKKFRKGIEYLKKAIDIGTDDLLVLSAIYSQLGNAFFSIGEYNNALHFHINDVMLTRISEDREGEMKATANVGNTYKALGDYDRALQFMQFQLGLTRELKDKACEARALYHIATIYQLKSRCVQKNASVQGITDAAYTDHLRTAIKYFEESLTLSKQLNDSLSCGRIYGSIGNAYYMLRDFSEAIDYHYKRLDIAREFSDRSATRRAYISLGNSHVFLPELEKAIEFYRYALDLARNMGDELAEAQTCFSLGNTAALHGDHNLAREYHEQHLFLARKVGDRAGEARALSELAADFSHLNDAPKAFYLLVLTRRIAREMYDESMATAATESMNALLEKLGEEAFFPNGEVRVEPCCLEQPLDGIPSSSLTIRLSRSLHSLVDESEFGDCGFSRFPPSQFSASDGDLDTLHIGNSARAGHSQDDFVEMIIQKQSKRLDEQRCDPSILSDVTNQKIRQTDQLVISPSVLSSTASKGQRRVSQLYSLMKSSMRPSKSALSSSGSAPLSPSTSASNLSAATVSPAARSSSSLTLPFRIPRLPHSRKSTKKLRKEDEERRREERERDRRRHSLAVAPSVDTPQRLLPPPWQPPRNGPEALIDLVMSMQGRRMEDQRATPLPGLALSSSNKELLNKFKSQERRGVEGEKEVDDHLYEIVLAAQSGRIDEQRSELGGRKDSKQESPDGSRRGMTIPEDDISEIVFRMQEGRIDDQRADLNPSPAKKAAVLPPASSSTS